MTGLEVYHRGVERWQQYCAERFANGSRGDPRPMLEFIVESIDEALAEARDAGLPAPDDVWPELGDDFSEGVAGP